MENIIPKCARYYIDKLGLVKLENMGGYIKVTSKSDIILPNASLPERFEGDRDAYSMNYYLLEKGETLNWHKLNQDEQWFYHAGGAIKISYFFPEEVESKGNEKFEIPCNLHSIVIGSDLDKGHQLQASVPHNAWFKAEIVDGDFCLVSCSLAPGFDMRDSTIMKIQESK